MHLSYSTIYHQILDGIILVFKQLSMKNSRNDCCIYFAETQFYVC